MSDRPRRTIIDANPNLSLVAVPLEEAAASLGLSLKTFNKQIRPHVPLIRLGRKVVVRVDDLERWARDNAQRTVDQTRR